MLNTHNKMATSSDTWAMDRKEMQQRKTRNQSSEKLCQRRRRRRRKDKLKEMCRFPLNKIELDLDIYHVKIDKALHPVRFSPTLQLLLLPSSQVCYQKR